MSWALDVAWASNTLGGTGTTITFTYGGVVAAGSLLVCFVGGATATITGVTDSVNGAWTEFGQGSPTANGGQPNFLGGWYFLNSAAGTPVITATYNATIGGRGIMAASYTGIATTSAFDVGSGLGQANPGTGTDAVNTGATGTTAQANSLAIAASRCGTGDAFTVGTGWTERFNAVVGSAFTGHVEDKNVASPATVTGTWTVSTSTADTASIVGVFKESGGAPAGTPFFAQQRVVYI